MSSNTTPIAITINASFEVMGRVQGVFFRKYTKKYADGLGLVGWVRNTSSGSVVGIAQGSKEDITKFKTWICTKGSPKSVITQCKVDTKAIDNVQFNSFEIKS
ncbi:hypothetical protein RTP6_005795 [Batrachochytrium dendrobatidis]